MKDQNLLFQDNKIYSPIFHNEDIAINKHTVQSTDATQGSVSKPNLSLEETAKQINSLLKKKSLSDYETSTDSIDYEELMSSLIKDDTLNSVCPKCGDTYIVKNGFNKKGNQRYLCKHCKSIFTSTSGTLTSYTRKSIDLWIKYIKCMILSMSVRSISSELGIHYNTAFQWRHKILHAMKNHFHDKEEGVIQVDEARFLLSHKGTNKISSILTPKIKYDRTAKNFLFGGNDNVVSVICSRDESNNIICETACIGLMKNEDIFYTLDTNIKEGSIFCTGRFQGYNVYAKTNNLIHIFRKGLIDNGQIITNIAAVRYKTELSKFISFCFRGVATKYLSHYLLWFKWLHKNPNPIDLLSKTYETRNRISIKDFCHVRPAYECR